MTTTPTWFDFTKKIENKEDLARMLQIPIQMIDMKVTMMYMDRQMIVDKTQQIERQMAQVNRKQNLIIRSLNNRKMMKEGGNRIKDLESTLK